MTYLDKDQVLAALDGLLSHWTQEGRDSVHKLLAALPAIPPSRGWTQEQIEDALFHVADDLLSEGGSLDYTAGVQDYQRELRDDILAALPVVEPDDRERIIEALEAERTGCDECEGSYDDGYQDAIELAIEKLKSALPVLETKKETE